MSSEHDNDFRPAEYNFGTCYFLSLDKVPV